MLESKTVTNGPIALQVQTVCHDTLPWLISFSLGPTSLSLKPTHARERRHEKRIVCRGYDSEAYATPRESVKPTSRRRSLSVTSARAWAREAVEKRFVYPGYGSHGGGSSVRQGYFALSHACALCGFLYSIRLARVVSSS